MQFQPLIVFSSLVIRILVVRNFGGSGTCPRFLHSGTKASDGDHMLAVLTLWPVCQRGLCAVMELAVLQMSSGTHWLIFLYRVITDGQGHCFSTANFAKFLSTLCEIPRCCYLQMPYIPRPVGVVVLTDNTSGYKEFIVTCNMKTHYIRPLMMKYRHNVNQD